MRSCMGDLRVRLGHFRRFESVRDAHVVEAGVAANIHNVFFLSELRSDVLHKGFKALIECWIQCILETLKE